MPVLCWFLPFSLFTVGATHHWDTSSLLTETSLEMPSQTHTQVCLPEDFKSSHGDSENYNHRSDSILFSNFKPVSHISQRFHHIPFT